MKKSIYLFLLIIFYGCSGTSVEYRSATTAARGDKDFNKAEKFALEAIEKYPTDALPAYFLATEIYAAKNSEKKDYNKAAEFFKKAIEMDNQTEEDQKLEEPIISQDEDGNLKQLLTIKEGIDYYSYSLWAETFNKGIELVSLANENLSDSGEPNDQMLEQAMESFHLAVALKSDESNTYTALATLYFEKQNYNACIENADKGLALDPSLSNLWSIKANISMQNNNNIEAEEMFRQAYNVAIQNNESPENISAHMSRLFDILFKNDKKDDALLLSEQLIASDPENVDLYRNAGVVYQNILNDKLIAASAIFNNLNQLNESDLENLKIEYEDCIKLSKKARENFLMCSELELDEETSQLYYDETKVLKSKINDIKRMIKRINKTLDEL